MMALALAVLLQTAASSAPAPAPPDDLVAAHPKALALMNAAQRQCKAEPTLLACYVYLQKVYALANDRQGGYLPQLLAPTASFLGRYRDAARWDPFQHAPRDKPSDTPLPQRGFHAVDAVDEVARLAQDRRLVMINEFHIDAATRRLTLALLPKLREEGFDYLAVEGIAEDGEDLARRGYAVADTGYYTREPVYAALLARAVKLGYTLVRYDTSVATQQGREDAQAQAIYAATFAIDPEARVLVHAGVDHIDEAVGDFGPDVQPMAMRLHALSGIDPLTIDQTVLRSRPAGQGSALYQTLIHAYAPKVPTILVNAHGTPWSARPGVTDISVLSPVRDRSHRRPRWLTLGGLRQPVPISTRDCHDTVPCAVAARPVGEPETAIPADRYAFLHAGRQAVLYLAPGQRYRIDATDIDGHRLSSRIVRPQVPSH